ncbi:hypothetical protein EYC59_02120 [Candidatus Saccharibacteria bacterium]|nr:MAG: hypothetical protein EYC59_02120 [Candidatus Saccharibacteria bacterium]
MHTTITLKQLRTDLPAVIEAVSKGKSFTVIKRSRPVFDIQPPEDEEWSFDFRDEEHPNGIPVEELLATMKEYRHNNPDQFED